MRLPVALQMAATANGVRVGLSNGQLFSPLHHESAGASQTVDNPSGERAGFQGTLIGALPAGQPGSDRSRCKHYSRAATEHSL